MDITYLGHSSFRIKGKSASVVMDPYDPKIVGIKLSKISADIVTISHDHKDHNYLTGVSDVIKVFSGPGEYEAMDVSIVGYPTYHDDKKGALRGKNTVYMIEMEGLRIIHLGDLGHQLSEKQVGEMGSVDVLILPIGDHFTIGPEVAAEVMRAIEPSYTIPMHFQVSGLDATFKELKGVEDFLSVAGVTAETLPKLSIRKETMGEEKSVVVLEKK